VVTSNTANVGDLAIALRKRVRSPVLAPSLRVPSLAGKEIFAGHRNQTVFVVLKIYRLIKVLHTSASIRTSMQTGLASLVLSTSWCPVLLLQLKAAVGQVHPFTFFLRVCTNAVGIFYTRVVVFHLSMYLEISLAADRWIFVLYGLIDVRHALGYPSSFPTSMSIPVCAAFALRYFICMAVATVELKPYFCCFQRGVKLYAQPTKPCLWWLITNCIGCVQLPTPMVLLWWRRGSIPSQGWFLDMD